MKQRTITSAIILAVMIPIALLSEYMVYPIAMSLFCLMATFEMLRVLGMEKRWLLSVPAYLLSLTLPLFTHDIFLGESHEMRVTYMLISAAAVFAYLLYIMGVSVFSKGELTIAKSGELFLAVTYIVISFTSLSLVRYVENGEFCFVLVFVAAWMSDSCAYIFGSLFGKHKLIPEISPKKTVEGAIGGIVCAAAAFLLYGLIIDLFYEREVNYIVLAIAGLVLAVVSQIGDLIASLIKREHGVKDYGTLLPGHGGIMDRFDSILAVSTPLIAICLAFPPFA